MLVTSIADYGQGIKQDKIHNIFDCFQTLKRKRNLVFEYRNGAGLGLSTAKALVEALGGFISIETKVNIGT
jgi:signal transduction histidine kinase